MKNGWIETTIGEVCLKSDHWIPHAQPRGDFFYIDVSAVSNDTFVIKSPQLVNSKTAPGRARKIIRAGDVLYATIRPTLRRIALVPPKYDNHIASTAFCVVRADREKAVPAFLYFLLLSDALNDAIAESQHGASYPAVTDKDIFKQKVGLPSLPEQKKIAAVLLKIQRAINAQEKIIQSLRDLKKSAMQHLFTRSLRGGKTKMTEIGEIPVGWKVCKFEDFASLHRGYDLPMEARVQGPVPVIGSNGIVGYHNQVKACGPGVVTGRSGSIGISYYVGDDFWPLNTGLYVNDFHGNNPLYVHYFFGWFDFGKYAAGVSVPTLNRNLVHRVVIAIPSINEQEKIANILTCLDYKHTHHEYRKSALQALFKTTLNKLMTGEIRVKDLAIEVSMVE